jgi:hypothetical protein
MCFKIYCTLRKDSDLKILSYRRRRPLRCVKKCAESEREREARRDDENSLSTVKQFLGCVRAALQQFIPRMQLPSAVISAQSPLFGKPTRRRQQEEVSHNYD